ncbi:glycoside hydrolase family 2 TIM barrel-domain containing protein [Kribbella hippodromi]|uniref:Glycoside hydrolase family 2 TIM barrel-domain containing protein n=1 Tax=Kribbella hippodromi TaxID=434347 RepID=A0ABN2CQV8_9ACTN
MSDWLFGGPFADARCAVGVAYDDSGFERVTLPHTVVPLSWRDWEPAAWQRQWCYRQWFDAPTDGQRVFVDVDGALHAAEVYVNGQLAGVQRGGYLAFSHEVTGLLRPGRNLLAIALDSRWLPIPPNGHPDGPGTVDYFQPGGISRGVSLRSEPETFLSEVYARPVDVLDPVRRRLDVTCSVNALGNYRGRLTVSLQRDGVVVATGSAEASGSVAASGSVGSVRASGFEVGVTLDALGNISLWSPESPVLYDVIARLETADGVSERTVRIGFREARFEVDGFWLNDSRVELFGLNRHQIFPWTGMAMPDRVQRRDAQILREEFNCTMVRCAHYPQSPAFLDACDELGLLVFEEIPGWAYVGDSAWQELMVADVERMIRRDRNRPSVVVWGVRVNESGNHPALYRRTQELAKRLDPDRATSGAMLVDHYSTDDFDQDVFAYNDYAHDENGARLLPPLAGIPFLVTEAIGSLAGPHFYRRTDPPDILARQAFLHAQVHHQAGLDDRYLGVLGWQAFDYDSQTGHVDHRLKCNGVADTFRIPKPGAAVYQAQVSPTQRPVIAPTFPWDTRLTGPQSIHTNCTHLELTLTPASTARPVASSSAVAPDSSAASTPPSTAESPTAPASTRARASSAGPAVVRIVVEPDGEQFGGLAYPPCFVQLDQDPAIFPDLRIDGYLDGHRVITRLFSADRNTDRLDLTPDDQELVADGTDMTRMVLRATDRHGNTRPSATGPVTLRLTGPAQLAGPTTVLLETTGGAMAVWVRTQTTPGVIQLTADHPTLGQATATITST